jgi:hypothetical protein
MKNQITGLLFALLTCIATVMGFGEEAYFIPLTWEIVRNERNSLNEADYYVSKTFSIRLDGRNNVKAGFVNGMYIVNEEKTSPQTINFTQGETKGKLDNVFDVPRGGEILEISFPEKNIRLKFARNTHKNRFELFSAVINANNYSFRFPDEPPYLTVKSNLKYLSGSEARAVPASEERNFPHIRPLITPSVTVGNQFTPSNRYGVINISGQGSLSKPVIISYIRHRNPNVSTRTVENIINTYFWAAGRESINPDLPIAQMCRTTNFLSNGIIMQTHNYAGFTLTPEWPGFFYGMKHGIIAHIQHLKGYASNARPCDLSEPLADPRWNMLDNIRGTIHTLEYLSKKWALYNPIAYENDIKDIIYEMRLFSRQSK